MYFPTLVLDQLLSDFEQVIEQRSREFWRTWYHCFLVVRLDIRIRMRLYSIIINYDPEITFRHGLTPILRPLIMKALRYDYIMVWRSYLIIISSPGQVSGTDVSTDFNS
jgi:hypothetical protein